jgi:hypothetical protein
VGLVKQTRLKGDTMKNLFKSITYDQEKNIITGSLEDILLLNKTFPGSTKNITGSGYVIKLLLTNKGTDKQKIWAWSRLQYILKEQYKITTKPVIKLKGGE